MASMSIAEELVLNLDEHKYTTCIRMLDEATAVSRNTFGKVKKTMSNEYNFNTSYFMKRNGRPIVSGLYDYFANLAGLTVDKLRDTLLDYVTENKKTIEQAVQTTLEERGSDINFWRLGICHAATPGCEVTLFCLCKMMHKHVIVYNTGCFWTMVQHKLSESESSVAEKCDIQMIYLGGGCYAVATRNIDKRKTVATEKSISELVKRTKITVESTSPQTSDSDPVQPAKCILRPRLKKRHTNHELRCTTSYIDYAKYGTDSNTEDEYKPKQKESRVGQQPSVTREISQTVITRRRLNATSPSHLKT